MKSKVRGMILSIKNRIFSFVLTGVVALFGVYGIAIDQSSGSGSTLSSNDWEFTIVPYFWMSSINGDITVKGITADMDVKFSDLFDVLDFGGQVHVEVRKGNFGVFIDPTYLQLSVDKDVQVLPNGGGPDVEVVLKEFLLEFGGFYRLGTWPIGSPYNSFVQKAKPSVTLDALVGGRYVNLDVEIDIDSALPMIPSEVDDDKDWLDPFVGARIILNPTEKLSFFVRSDIGGGDFDFASDITWNLVGYVGYELPWYGITPLIGYRVLYIDYDDGSGDDRFVYKTWTYGPIIGIGFRF